MDLDKLQYEATKLLALLRARHPGSTAWNDFLHDRLHTIVDMAASVGIRAGGDQ